MVSVIKTFNNNIEYLCECGVEGRCLIRPFEEKDTIVVDIECAFCGKSSRVTLSKNKNKNINESDMSFAVVLLNKITKKAK